MTDYVLGFLWHNDFVLLVKKKFGPEFLIDKWNGIGGKIEPGEEPVVAMMREFSEEIDLEYHLGGWRFCCRMELPKYDATVCCYALRRNVLPKMPKYNDVGEHLVYQFCPQGIPNDCINVAPELEWILPLSFRTVDPNKTLLKLTE